MARFLAVCLFLISFLSYSQNAPYLNEESYTYSSLIDLYKSIAQSSELVQIKEAGLSDIGKPIHLVVVAKQNDFNPALARKHNKSIVFINNGIHAGEACGIDASVELLKKLIDPQSAVHKALDSTVVLIVPVYNVGGMLNRGAYSRANQVGPKEHGFRGNAKNLDLNRDFIKLDSKNAKTFTQVIRTWDPDVFVDTHTTNGSDHQYTLTLIATQRNKQNFILSSFAEEEMIPTLYTEMSKRYMDMIPYVYSYKRSPDQGIKDFLETPRYSSGYASLFDCLSFITEAHVYKPFSQRVKHTLGFLEVLVNYTAENTSAITSKRAEAKKLTREELYFPIKWQLDTNRFREIQFNGYSTEGRESEVTGQEMMFYNREKPYYKKIRHYNTYQELVVVERPEYYIVPQAYERVIERLQLNQVELQQLDKDIILEVEVYFIVDSKTPAKPYEAHFLHSDIQVERKKESIQLYKGDYLIPVNQDANRYIVETLEPQSTDGFFAWNFFDGILQQKEWFSDYAFEPKAKKFLEEHPEIKKEFEQKKANDESFAKNSWAQLYYIYKKSPYYEKTVNRFPIYRLR